MLNAIPDRRLFARISATAADIRATILRPAFSNPPAGGAQFRAVEKEAVVQISSSLAMIAHSEPDNVESWRAIATYAGLVVAELEE